MTVLYIVTFLARNINTTAITLWSDIISANSGYDHVLGSQTDWLRKNYSAKDGWCDQQVYLWEIGQEHAEAVARVASSYLSCHHTTPEPGDKFCRNCGHPLKPQKG